MWVRHLENLENDDRKNTCIELFWNFLFSFWILKNIRFVSETEEGAEEEEEEGVGVDTWGAERAEAVVEKWWYVWLLRSLVGVVVLLFAALAVLESDKRSLDIFSLDAAMVRTQSICQLCTLSEFSSFRQFLMKKKSKKNRNFLFFFVNNKFKNENLIGR